MECTIFTHTPQLYTIAHIQHFSAKYHEHIANTSVSKTILVSMTFYSEDFPHENSTSAMSGESGQNDSNLVVTKRHEHTKDFQ